jgi:AraC-like DNA-binding protein
MKTEPTSKEKLTESAVRYLNEHCMERFSLDDMANALFVNKHYLARTFRECTGSTPLYYHNELRCQQARKLLADPGYSIQIVAFRAGFTSASHFSRVFREHTGMTPTEYRRLNR